jgi:hypothetical protein
VHTIAASFHQCRPTPWAGRYARIPGKGTVFHLETVRRRLWPVIHWKIDEDWGICRAVECEAAEQLALAVATAKRHAGGSGGGCFAINEFGKVIVPATDHGGKRYLAGTLHRRLLFHNPFCPDEPIDLGDERHLQPGDPWKLPYVGIPHHLHRDGHIYFYNQDGTGGSKVYPQHQDMQLIRELRSLRPRGPIRFIINPAGLVLTKIPPDTRHRSEERWQPIYVGSVSLTLWFAKE